MTKELVTPIQVAQAIDVSESSVKRWCDKGIIPTKYTAGGHRRIPVAGLLAFLRTQNLRLARPEILGLPPLRGELAKTPELLVESFTASLLSGDYSACRALILEVFLAEYHLAVIGDRILAPAMHQIGDRWECRKADIFQERHACEICLKLVHELSIWVENPPDGSPLALGGTPSGDQYLLPTALVELVLKDAKWQAISLGHNLPLASFEAAIKEYRPRLVWLSISHVASPEEFRQEYDALFDRFGDEVLFVVGGRAMATDLRHGMRYAVHGENLGQLAAFATTLRGQIASR